MILAKYIINHSLSLNGKVRVNGAKNSALPILAACLLADGESIIEDIPYLKDVENMCDLLKWLGLNIETSDNSTVKINASKLSKHNAPMNSK